LSHPPRQGAEHLLVGVLVEAACGEDYDDLAAADEDGLIGPRVLVSAALADVLAFTGSLLGIS